MRASVINEQLKEALEKYWSGEYDNRTLRPKSLRDRRGFLRQLMMWFDENGWEFTDINIRAFVKYQKERQSQYGNKNAASSIGYYIGKLRALNQFMVRQDYLDKNFCKDIAKPPEHEMEHELGNIYSLETIYKAVILGTTPGKFDFERSKFIKSESRAAFELILRSPRRSGEIWNLKGSDIQENGMYKCVMKGGETLTFPIPTACEAMMRSRRHRDRVFMVRPETLAKHLRDGLLALGERKEIAEKIRVHDIRAFVAIDKLDHGWTLKKVSQVLGHKRQATTERHYIKHVGKHLQEITDDNPLDPDVLPISNRIQKAMNSLSNIFNGKRFAQPRIIMQDNAIIYVIPLTELGTTEIGKSHDVKIVREEL